MMDNATFLELGQGSKACDWLCSVYLAEPRWDELLKGETDEQFNARPRRRPRQNKRRMTEETEPDRIQRRSGIAKVRMH